MLGKRQKKFFAVITWGASELSACSVKKGAVVVKEKIILGYGFNRKIIKNKNYEISAIYDAIFSARSDDLTGTYLFTTHFPVLEECKLIISCGISTIYFFGEITDPYTVEIANNTSKESINLKFIKLT